MGSRMTRVSPFVSPRRASREVLARLSNNLRNLRAARGFTQENLAKLCRFNRNYISNIEHGSVNVTVATLEALAKGLGCTEARLLARRSER